MTSGQRRLAILVAGVLVAHAIALEGVVRLQLAPILLKPLPAPVFTRLLTPKAPPEPPAAPLPATPPAKPAPRKDAMQAAPSTALAPTLTETVSAAPPAPPAPPAPAPEFPADQAVAAAPAPPVPVPPAPDAAASADAQAAAPTAPPAPSPDAGEYLQSWPADTRLSFRVDGQYRGGELHGKASVLWQRQGSRYQNRIEIDMLLAGMTLTSQGEVTTGGLLPQVYEEARRSKPRTVRIGEREILFADGNVVRRPDGVQDTASQFVELSWRFASGREKLEVGRAISFWMARPNALDLWTYDIVGRESIQTSRLGVVEAFHLKPRPIANPRGNITAEMWFAPSLHYLPVRIRVNMGDDAHLELNVERIEQQ